MTIRILFLMRDPLPPFRADVQILFGKYLPRLAIFSDILGQKDPNYTGDINWPAGKTIIAGAEHKGILAEFIRPFLDGMALLKHHDAFDIIQVRDKIRTAIFAWAYARWHKKPFVYWMSFPFVEGFEITARNRQQPSFIMKLADHIRINASRYLFYNWVLPKADHIFVQSDAMRDWLIEKGFNSQHMTAVPMGVDLEKFKRDRIIPSDDARLQNRRIIIYAGSISKSRHSDFLLDLTIAIKKHQPSILLILAGDAPSIEEQQWIREEISQRDLHDYVFLTGWLSQDQMLGYIIRAEVGLSPIPRGELFDVSSPTKLIEYLALGLPAVANDIPDQKLVIEQSLAGLCVPMEINAFRDAVLKLLQDPAFHRQCTEKGPAFINSNRTYAVIAEKVACVYQTVLKRTTFIQQ
ncbi:MAG: glycosyltransferase [Methylococcaceae bacterium]|nr:glycosyltransferase [Methylococcaceae bacterium]